MKHFFAILFATFWQGICPAFAKADEDKPGKGGKDEEPDADFFKENPDLTEDDKAYLRSAWLKRKYIAHREAKEKPESAKPKGGMFGGRTR